MFKLDADIIRGYINDPSIGYSRVEKILDAAHALRYQIPRVVGVKELSDEERKEELKKFLDTCRPIVEKVEKAILANPEINKV